MAAGALDRGAVLRHLPLALPGDRADGPAPATPASSSAGRRCRRWPRSCSRRSRGAGSRTRSAAAPSARLWRRARSRAEGRTPAGAPAAWLGGPGGRDRGNRDRGLRAQRRELDRPRDRALGLDPGDGRRGRLDRPPAPAQARAEDGGEARAPARALSTALRGPPATPSSTSATRPPTGWSPPRYLPTAAGGSTRSTSASARSGRDADRGRDVDRRVRRTARAHTTRQRPRRAGFRGCWVIALGTNDTATSTRAARSA